MHPYMSYELAKLHGQDLAREAEIDRLARLAMGNRPRRRVRIGLGRVLVRLGVALAGVCSAEALERRSPQAAR